MSSRDITRKEGNTFPSTQKVENEPSKFKTFGFAVLIIFGIGGLVVAGVGTGGLLHAGSLTNLGRANSIIMIVIGGVGGISLLVIGIVGFVNTRSGSGSGISEKTDAQGTKHSTLNKSDDTEHDQEEIKKVDEERRAQEGEGTGQQKGLKAQKIEERKKTKELEALGQRGEQERKNRAEAEKSAREEGAAPNQKEELEAKKVEEEEKKGRGPEAARLLEEQERLKKAEGEKKANEAHQSAQKFLTWLQKDTKRLEIEENATRLIAIIKNEEVKEEEIRLFYAGLDESLVLQILNLTQTSNSFNAIDEQIIEKALIVETNFIQAINKKGPHRNPILREKIEKALLWPSIFRHSMEDEQIIQIGAEYFSKLEGSGQLVTSEQLGSFRPTEAGYRDKGCDLGRILGANYIKEMAEKLGLKRIKVPKKVAVVKEGITELNASVNPCNLELSCKNITIYAEEITPLSRVSTQEEQAELRKILEAMEFRDFLKLKFFLGRDKDGEEGIYFISTKYTNFHRAPIPKQPWLGKMMKTYEAQRREKGVEFTYTLDT